MQFYPWEICDGVRPSLGYDEEVQRMFYDQSPEQAVHNPTVLGGEVGYQQDWDDTFAFRRVKKPKTYSDSVKLAGLWFRLECEVVNGEPVNPKFERIE